MTASPETADPIVLRRQPPRAASASPASRLRIAHVQLLPMLSGVQRVTLEELTALDTDIFERTLICQRPGPLTEAARKLGIHCELVPSLVRPISPRNDAAALVQLTRLMRAGGYDIVHTHSSKTGVLGRLAARMARVPVVVHTVHGFAFPAEPSRWKKGLYAGLERLGGRCSDAVVCLNTADCQTAEKLGVADRRLHLIPNGVDLRRFHPVSSAERGEFRSRLGLPADEPVAVMVGRLWPQKDPLTFVEAAIRCIRSGAPGHFVLIGDGRMRTEIEQRLVDADATGRVHLLGWRDDVAELLPAMDVFVLASRWEGMPLAILEALACGLACIVSDIPGNRDLVSDGEDGFVTPVGDANSLAEKMRQLLTQPEVCQKMGRVARWKAEQDYPLSRRMDTILGLYDQLTAEKGRNRRGAFR